MSSAQRQPRRAGNSRLRVVTVLNFKGGVGKTTVVSHLGPHLVAQMQQRNPRARLLVVDADTQCGATITLTGQDPTEFTATVATVLAGRQTLRDAIVVLDADPRLDEHIREARTGTDLLPSNEHAKVHVEQVEDFWTLHEMLRDPELLPPDTELVVIDCGYGDTDLTELAMVAADQIIAVVTPNALDVHGLNLLFRKIARMRPTFPDIALTGVVVNQLTSHLADEEVLNDLVDQLGSRLWSPLIPHRGAIRRANNQHLPMAAYHPQRPELINLFAALATKMLSPSRPGRHRLT